MCFFVNTHFGRHVCRENCIECWPCVPTFPFSLYMLMHIYKHFVHNCDTSKPMNNHKINGLMIIIKLENLFYNHAHMCNSIFKYLTQACCDYGLGLGLIFITFV